MKLPDEFIQEIGLTEDQVQKIAEHTDKYVEEKESEWSAVANTNAEKIIEGAIEPIVKLTGINREKGQKAADYLKLASENYFKGQKATLERKEQELKDKIKSTDHDESLLKELEDTKEKLTQLKEKEAKFAEWEENDYKGKYEETTKELDGLKLDTAFNEVKPTFPESVNEYEARYKWEEFIKSVKDKYKIKYEDNEWFAFDRENEFKKVKLSELVKKDQNIASLLKGETKGLGAKPTILKIEGIPFDVPEGINPKERNELIREYLINKKGLDPVSSKEYAQEFAELNKKILAQKTAT